MAFGDREEMLKLAKSRLGTVKAKFPKAMLLNPDAVNVIYLVAFDPKLYSDYAVASLDRGGLSRGVAIRKMMGPLARMMRV
jgi:formate dehydrogenase iron-sulfur subunit